MRRVALVLCVLCLVWLAGCVGGEPRVNGTTEITFSIQNTSSSTAFRLNGTVQPEGGVVGPDVFSDVTVCLYGTDGRLLHQTPGRDLNQTAELDVSLTTDTAPEYVVVDSPDFWTIEDIEVTYYQRTTQGGATYLDFNHAESRDELPEGGCRQ